MTAVLIAADTTTAHQREIEPGGNLICIHTPACGAPTLWTMRASSHPSGPWLDPSPKRTQWAGPRPSGKRSSGG